MGVNRGDSLILVKILTVRETITPKRSTSLLSVSICRLDGHRFKRSEFQSFRTDHTTCSLTFHDPLLMLGTQPRQTHFFWHKDPANIFRSFDIQPIDNLPYRQTQNTFLARIIDNILCLAKPLSDGVIILVTIRTVGTYDQDILSFTAGNLNAQKPKDTTKYATEFIS